MPKPVSLRSVVDAMDMSSDMHRSYLNPDNGELIIVDDEMEALLEQDADPAEVPGWQAEVLAELRELDFDRLLPLPDRLEIHEWEIMRRFAQSRPAKQCNSLLDAIHGSGAFRVFRRELGILSLRDAWYEHRNAEFERLAREWLESNGLTAE